MKPGSTILDKHDRVKLFVFLVIVAYSNNIVVAY
jgi:hypothetical protein